jgi:solute carrier family 41
MQYYVSGLITAAVIVFSRHCSINPDNVATPIAASLGDITSLALLSWISTVLYDAIGRLGEAVVKNWCES